MSVQSSPVINTRAQPKITLLRRFKKELSYHLMIWPGIVYFFIFCYIPMFGLIMAFKEFDLTTSILGAPNVGLLQFIRLFEDTAFWEAVRNTLAISLIKFIPGFIAPIIFAILLNEVAHQRFKKIVQTVSYLPYFISWVVVASLMIFWLNTDYQGVINVVLMKLHIIAEPIAFLTYPKYFWGIAAISDIWKNMGWWGIIYIAAMSGIDQELYEAATIDGAGRFAKILHITLPGIKPAMFTILILSVGGLLAGNFDQSFLLGNGMNAKTSDILDTYVLRLGIRLSRYSFATAAGLARSIINTALVFFTNWIIKRIDKEQGIF